MTFIDPTALAWLGLALPIVLLYLIRVRTRELAVGTDQFWEQIFEDRTLRSAWRWLRDPASLLAQLALLAMIVFALAEPVSSRDQREARRLVLVVDNSASMSAADGSPTRLAEALQQARRLVGGLRARDLAALVVAGTRPRVACGLTADRRILNRALDGVEQTDCPTRIRAAVDLARRLLSGHKNAQIELLTDGCDDAIDDVARASDIRLRKVGRRTGNVGITSFQTRRSLRDLTGYQILIEVANYSDEPVRCRLEIERNGTMVDVIPLSIAAGSNWRQVLDKASNEGGRLRARIDRPDALAVDNEAWAILQPREPLAVEVFTSDQGFADLYVEKVLEANPLVRQPPTVIKGPAKDPGGKTAAIRIYHRRVPARIPPGPVLVIGPDSSCDLWDIGEPIRGPIVGKQEGASPLLAFVKLENAQIAEARGLTPKGRAEVLVSLVTGEPIYVAFDRPEGKVVVLAAALDDPGDLPLRTAFPILVGNALSWFDGRRDELHESVASGTMIDLPAVRRDLSLWPPAGPSRRLPDGEGRLSAGPLDRLGIWRVAAGSGASAVLETACNLASPRESDLRAPAGLKGSGPAAMAGVGAVPAWYALILLAFASFVLEWFCYQRRWIR